MKRLGVALVAVALLLGLGLPTSRADVTSPVAPLVVQTGAFTASLTGCTTVPTGSVRWVRYGYVVLLEIPSISATSNTTAATLTGLPTALTPPRTQRLIAGITDNGTIAAGVARIDTSAGTITMFPSVAGGAFTGSGTKGVAQNTISYSIAP